MNKIIKPYTQIPFLVCLAVLALAAGFKEAAIDWSGAKLKKQSIPLRKSLDDLHSCAIFFMKHRAQYFMALHDSVPGSLKAGNMKYPIERDHKLLIGAGLIGIKLLKQPETLLWI